MHKVVSQFLLPLSMAWMNGDGVFVAWANEDFPITVFSSSSSWLKYFTFKFILDVLNEEEEEKCL